MLRRIRRYIEYALNPACWCEWETLPYGHYCSMKCGLHGWKCDC